LQSHLYRFNPFLLAEFFNRIGPNQPFCYPPSSAAKLPNTATAPAKSPPSCGQASTAHFATIPPMAWQRLKSSPSRAKALPFDFEWAHSSVVEHCVDIAGVGSSILPAPTIFPMNIF
jgi:hypothetical protein